MAQAAPGSGPEIAGQNIANPTAMILSAGMLLDTLGTRRNRPELLAAAMRLDEAIDTQLSEKDGCTPDLGGPLGTDAFGAGVAEKVKGQT